MGQPTWCRGELNWAAPQGLETNWSMFVNSGLLHDSAWNAYGPYLTGQLAHCFLLLGDVQRLDRCLSWAVGNAGYARISGNPGSGHVWQDVQRAWNEQHCYPISTDSQWRPDRSRFMGDIPHCWACAEFLRRTQVVEHVPQAPPIPVPAMSVA